MTELHTIEVRYEDETGRHVDVHEAACSCGDEQVLTVRSDVCACCEATEAVTKYNHDNLVKVEYGDSEHERVDVDREVWPIALVILFLLFVAVMVWIPASSGGIGF